jgi:hypothetical protein
MSLDYWITITKMSDMSISVIYHAMFLTVLYHYHQDEWNIYHSDLSSHVSDCTVFKYFVLYLLIFNTTWHFIFLLQSLGADCSHISVTVSTWNKMIRHQVKLTLCYLQIVYIVIKGYRNLQQFIQRWSLKMTATCICYHTSNTVKPAHAVICIKRSPFSYELNIF